MVWLKRRLEGIGYTPYMDYLEKLLLNNKPLYQEFIMVSRKTDEAGVSDYYIGLPNEAFVAGFDGFERANENELPKSINAVLIADQTKKPFTSRFQFAPPF